MPEEHPTIDISAEISGLREDVAYLRGSFEQMDKRLSSVEGNLLQFRDEAFRRFDGLRVETADLRRSFDQKFIALYAPIGALIIGVAGLWFK